MKLTDKKKPIDTIPKGVWESSHDTKHKKDEQEKLSTTADLQGNGYPNPSHLSAHEKGEL